MTSRKLVVVFLALSLAAPAQLTTAVSSTPLLRYQHSVAFLESERAAPHAQGMQGMTYGNPGETNHYPNTISCTVIDADGHYVLEKTDERTLGRPKTKRAEGTLTPEELQALKAILDADSFKKMQTLPMPAMPDFAVAVRELESVTTEVNRDGAVQAVTVTRERMKTNRTSGMDEFLTNAGPNDKLMSPLTKWMKDAEKRMSQGLKDGAAQSCRPLAIG
jgi:hypothetical protein